jgi:hypothetical protein
LRQSRTRIGKSAIPAGENAKLEKHLGTSYMTNADPGTAVAFNSSSNGGLIMASGKADELKGRV